MLNKPKIIFIDWAKTLSETRFWQHLQDGGKEDKELFNKIDKALFKSGKDLKPWMRGEVDYKNILQIISKELDIDFKLIRKHFIKSCREMKFVNRKIPKLIKKLRSRNIKTYIATDNMDSFNYWTIPSLNLRELFDGILNSFDIKNLKRDFDKNGESLFFSGILKSEGVKPSETILIDDKEDKDSLFGKYGIDYRQVTSKRKLDKILEEILLELAS